MISYLKQSFQCGMFRFLQKASQCFFLFLNIVFEQQMYGTLRQWVLQIMGNMFVLFVQRQNVCSGYSNNHLFVEQFGYEQKIKYLHTLVLFSIITRYASVESLLFYVIKTMQFIGSSWDVQEEYFDEYWGIQTLCDKIMYVYKAQNVGLVEDFLWIMQLWEFFIKVFSNECRQVDYGCFFLFYLLFQGG
eukprot:TRINITY_DN14175_c0_g2_i14.p3 TRINITY_DN14175_c0_g2~~TRINITY_DN14175_c0_g2_i14.p3  ORF type:complete len:189 (+),score=5.18 TRINITY_DN14175_c0_g2_i14:2280-2846(+)